MSKQSVKKSPYIIMGDYFMCLFALNVLSAYYYGIRTVYIMLLSLSVSYVTDIICVKLRGDKFSIKDISAIVSSLIFTALLPVTMPYSMVAISSVVMIIIGKQVFGGIKNRIFSPACVGFIFAYLCFKDYMFMYPIPVGKGSVGLSSYISENLVNSFTLNLSKVSEPMFNWSDMIMGKIAGPMGVSCILLIVISAVVLSLRKSISPVALISTVGTILLVTFFSPMQYGIGHFDSIVYEIFSGAMMFCAVFIVSNKNYLPQKTLGIILFGVSTGLLTLLFRRFAGIEIGIVFAVILTQAIRDYFDVLAVRVKKVIIYIVRKTRYVLPRIGHKISNTIHNAKKKYQMVKISKQEKALVAENKEEEVKEVSDKKVETICDNEHDDKQDTLVSSIHEDKGGN